MSSPRSIRVVRPGQMAVEPGASPRVDQGGKLKPAFQLQGTGQGIGVGILGDWLDPGTPQFWRLVITLAAFGYIAAWHMRLPVVGRVRV